jgi:hypothetical protein
VAVTGIASLGGRCATDAGHHRVQKALLHGLGHLGSRKEVRRGLGEVDGSFMRLQQPQ